MLLKRTLGLGYLTGVALLIGSMSFLHLMEPGEPFLGRILSFVALIGLSGPLLWSVYWLKSQEFTADRIWRTVRWSLVGLVAITLLASITVFYERSHGVFLADVTMIMLWIAGTGATAGIIIGWYNLQYQLQIEKVRQTATHLSTVVETLPVALIEIDQAGAVTRWNPTAEQIFGWNEEDIRDQRLPIIPEDSEQCKEWREIIENEESVVAKELHCRGKSDIQITARLWTAPLEDTEGDIVGTILVITDVTDKAQRRQRLEVINRILRHNLRNKLTVIQGNTSLLQKKISDSDLQSKITTIINSTQRLARLSKEAQDIHNALTTDTASQQAYDIVSLIDRIQNEFQQPEADATLRVTAPEAAYAAVDPTIELAIREAIENAVEHTHQADPTIDVGVLKNDNQTDPDSVEITIADNGPGIPEQERIPLEQGNETSLQHSSGLGLWKIKWITNDNGGTVTITENEPNGTVVTFTLPAIASATTLEIETP